MKIYDNDPGQYGLICGLMFGVAFAVLNLTWRSRSVGITLLETALFAVLTGAVSFFQSWTHRRRS